MSEFTTYQIPEDRVPELQARVEKLNKKATKLGTPPITLVITGKTKEITVSLGGRMRLRMGSKHTYTAVEVMLKGDTPKLNGWEFLSVVLHRPAGNEMVSVTDTSVDLSEFVFTDKDCDHCHQNRVRNATFLIRYTGSTLGFSPNGQDTYAYGDIKQVGSTCLTDYTGVKSPQAHATQLENIYNLFREVGGWGMTPGRTTRKFFLAEWMAFVAMEVRQRGFYVGRDRAYDNGEETTGQKAKRAIILASQDMNAPIPAEEDYQAAEKAIAWVRTVDGVEYVEAMGDYGTQLLAATASDDADAVAENTMNIVAPLIAIHGRWIRENTKLVEQTGQEYFGTKGDRVNRILTLTRKSQEQAGDYGAYAYLTLKDDAGRVYSIRAGVKYTRPMEVGQRMTVRGTITKHDIDSYTKDKTTYMNRCKFEEAS